MLEFIYSRIKYPKKARQNGVEGMVVLTFVVEKDGTISEEIIVRDIGAGCGQESLRVVKLMNKEKIKWTPGKQDGKPIRVQFNLPIKFKLD
ncbi:MAG: energy transducer TonB [Saprospiraceae bacterium]|nr:energy transducer TonB [Saprospiraceae bacterium]MDZ4705435.1 energy transducer TonB [Saprospiraceae bacterium]